MQGQTNKKIISERRARILRNRATEAEHRLWQFLRARQLQDSKFRRQHPFGDYILDFVCLDRKIVIELDGSQHADATHYDAARTRFLSSAGFTVLRFWNNEVFDNIQGVIDVITEALQHHWTPSPPNPPLEGEG